MNARLAARLTGWKIDIKSDTEFATEEADAAYAGGRRRGRRVHRPLRRGALDRQALPQRGAAGLSLLRSPCAPGAGAQGGRGGAARSRSPSSGPRLKSRPPRNHSRSWRSPAEATPEPEPEPAGVAEDAGRRSRRTRPLRERSGQDVRGLWPQGAAGRARALRRSDGALTPCAEGTRGAAPTRAGGSPASSGRPRGTRSAAC